MQFNIHGLAGKIEELVHFLGQNDIIGCRQESKLNAMSRLPRCPGFTIIQKDREINKGGGLAFLVRDTLQFHLFDVPPSPDPTQEQQAIAVKSGDGELKIINVYIPPISSSPTAFIPSLSHLYPVRQCLILSDFNAHHP